MASNTASPDVALVQKDAHPFERAQLEGLMTKRFFYTQAFEIYGGVAGLYDYGPSGAALQANLINFWRTHFIIEEDMLELDTTIMTLSDVLKTSGHVEKFADYMVKDTKTGDIYRADHMIENVLEARLQGDKEARGKERGAAEPEVAPAAADKKSKKKAKSQAIKLDDAVVDEYTKTLAMLDDFSGAQLAELIQKHDLRAPATNNEVTKPVEFNLMFESSIGPTGQTKGFLRPETAQGHFVNFERLLDFNNGRVPFASAQIGKSFRNEISPRAGLLRVREFTMAEIEHFLDPEKKQHPRFKEVEHLTLPFLDKHVQMSGNTTIVKMTLGEAVRSGKVDNETLGYFLGRIYLFLEAIGIDLERLRFRQHMDNEMAHYASDCWDAEIHTSYGWIECVGSADRSAFDLTMHSKRTKHDLVVQEALKEPKVYQKYLATMNKKVLGPAFKKDAKGIEDAILALSQDQLKTLMHDLDAGSAHVELNGAKIPVNKEHVTVEYKTIKESVRTFVPNVIEPSFGIGRIFYALLEHAFWARAEDKDRGVLSLPPLVAPFKVLIVPISNNEQLSPLAKEVSHRLRKMGIASRIDDSSATIGRRYARNDELGTPFACTIDFATVAKGTITLRERDTTSQRIGKIDQIISVLKQICDGSLDWKGACQILPEYTGTQDVEDS
ncbi:glycine--tRNA ligase [Malassezia vespertilionis]|uniref:glycine--tRNA ligase n=1 Tax=Malassezia vespertilionis TaxID=2020962 RepID=A0A2N1JE66_9BASI|nr:glycine--tRNA ligase [Malassezia vespertilionis]PKI84822.1 Grs1p [Malassezia vespertilionis]WFD05597.1 glycine--tRNA ligase [Malassezia vespertilionis]